MEQRGAMSFSSCWRAGRCKQTQPLLQSSQPATNTKYLHTKMVKKFGATCHRNSENKIIKQNKNVLPRYLKQINNKIFKQTSF